MKTRTRKTAQPVENYWQILKRTPGSARVKISNAVFGERYLGGEDFCVFKNLEAARAEIEILRSNENARAIDEWEIHVLRSDLLWETVAAGEFTLENAPGKQTRVYPSCAECGNCRSSVMFRDYEQGAEWANLPCCDLTV